MFENDCDCQDKKRKCCADKITLVIILLLFVFVIGVIVGALTGLFALIGTAGFVVIAVALGVIALIRLVILVFCCKRRC